MGVDGYWRYSKETMQKKYDAGLIVVTDNNLQQKYYESQAKQTRRTVTTWWDDDFLTSSATTDLQNLMGGKTFDNPKNVNLILRTLKMITNDDEDAIILDFFSGSGTTAQAVMEMNVSNGGSRKFILIQLNEETPEDSDARKLGYLTIPQIAKERIRRAAKVISKELEDEIAKKDADIYKLTNGAVASTNPSSMTYWSTFASDEEKERLFSLSNEKEILKDKLKDLDIGFRVLKLDSSNMVDVFYTPEDFDAKNLFTMVDNVKEDRTPEDLLFQIMPELNIPLSAKIETKDINGKKVFVVDDGYLVATFDKDVNTETVKILAQMNPQYFVMRDASVSGDNVLDDFDQIFRHYSPDTIRKIL